MLLPSNWLSERPSRGFSGWPALLPPPQRNRNYKIPLPPAVARFVVLCRELAPLLDASNPIYCRLQKPHLASTIVMLALITVSHYLFKFKDEKSRQ